jgi:hypothetical protein
MLGNIVVKWWGEWDLNPRSTSVFYDDGQLLTPQFRFEMNLDLEPVAMPD